MRQGISRWREHWFSTARADRPQWRRTAWRVRAGVRQVLVGRPLARFRQPPDVVIVGAQRSGTTSLFRLLQAHADVVWPLWIKSPHWFDVNFDRSRSWYLGHFPLKRWLARGGRRRLTGEAAPYYLFHPHVAERLADELPACKVIAILRDPVDRAWSHYQHEVARGNEHLAAVSALDAEPQRLADAEAVLARDGGVHTGHLHHAYVGRGRYAEQIERYIEHLGRDRILVLFTQELNDAPQDVSDRICDFLELPRQQLPARTKHHARAYEPIAPDVEGRLRAALAADVQATQRLLARPVPWGTS